MRMLPQQEHCDLGLVDDDRTPDMRKGPGGNRGPSDQSTPQSPQPPRRSPNHDDTNNRLQALHGAY